MPHSPRERAKRQAGMQALRKHAAVHRLQEIARTQLAIPVRMCEDLGLSQTEILNAVKAGVDETFRKEGQDGN